MSGRSKRALAVWLLSTVVLCGAVRVAVAVPEKCGSPTRAEIDRAISGAIGWFTTNQLASGRWTYRYDTVAERDLGGYEWVRHAGVLLSLEQAARAGRASAERPLASGWRAIERQYGQLDIDGVATIAVRGTSAVTGGAALTGIALSERRLRTNDPSLDEPLLGFARFVSAQVRSDGSVMDKVDLSTGVGVTNSRSPFVTGQALFLFARARAILDTKEFDDEMVRIISYLARQRAAKEGFVPDVSDHWAAYGMAVLEADAPDFLNDAATVAFVRKQLGITGVQVRYESQRTNSHLNRWTRGRQTLGAGLGTLGEAIGEWRKVIPRQPALVNQRPALDERLTCVAGLLVDRQVRGRGVAEGSWTQFGVTQMDDQQHALSALLAAREVDLDAPNAPRRAPVPENAVLAILLAVALVNPVQLSRRSVGCKKVRTAVFGVAVICGLAAVGGPLVRAIEVSAATAVVGAGCAIVVTAIASLLGAARRRVVDDSSTIDFLLVGLLRPETLLASIAIGAGGQGWAWSASIACLAFISIALGQWATRLEPGVAAWAVRLATCGAVVLGIAMVVEGAYAV